MLTCDPKVLPGQATCFHCIGPEEKQVLNLFLLNQIAGTGKTPQQLAGPAAQFRPFNAKMALGAKAYLLAVASMMSTDPKVLLKTAKCWPCIPRGSRLDVEDFLQANNAGGSTSAQILGSKIAQYRGLYPMRRQVELYLLSVIAGVTNLATIINGAKCFIECLDRTGLDSIILFLECAGISANLIPVGSVYGPGTGAGPEFDFAVSPNTCYQVCFGSNEVRVVLPVSGQTFNSTGAGTCIVVNTDADTVMQFFGNAVGSTVTAIARRCTTNQQPTPSGFNFQIDGVGTVTASWHTPPTGTTATQVWTSTDGVNFSLAATVNAPTTFFTQAPIAGVTMFAKIRWTNGIVFGNFSAVLSVNGTVADWVRRVNVNGGAAPSANTIAALSTFDNTMVSNSFVSRFYMLNPVAPDNLIASQTPLYKVKGNDPWTNNGPFVAGDLTVNGLAGNGTTKFLDSGMKPSSDIAGAFDFGISWLMFDAANETVFDFGSGNSPYTEGYGGLHLTNLQVAADMSYNNATGRDAANAGNWRGFASANRRASNEMHIFLWSDVLGINGTDALLNANTVDGRASVTSTMITHGTNLAGVASLMSAHRYSFFATHTNFNLTDAGTLKAAIKTLRNAFGGGWV